MCFVLEGLQGFDFQMHLWKAALCDVTKGNDTTYSQVLVLSNKHRAKEGEGSKEGESGMRNKDLKMGPLKKQNNLVCGLFPDCQ